tara:strand:+ start:258 stop:584 length:327 start_codon:yes stop_codon:yes gene_type:complete
MATYPVRNKETGEEKEVIMSVHAWDQWKTDNPDWERFFTPENSPAMGLETVGDWKDKLTNKNPGWGEILKKADKAGGISGRLAKKGGINSTQEHDDSYAPSPKEKKSK